MKTKFWVKGVLTPGGGRVFNKEGRGMIVYLGKIKLGSYPNGGAFVSEWERISDKIKRVN